MRVSPVTGASSPQQKPQGVAQGNHPPGRESPVKDTKPTLSGGSMDGCGNSLSTKDMIQLVQAIKMMEELKEVTGDIIKKFMKH